MLRSRCRWKSAACFSCPGIDSSGIATASLPETSGGFLAGLDNVD
jgi:hypothetical protein